MPTYENGQVYWCKVVEQKFGTNSKGNPQFNVTFQVRGLIDALNPDGDLLRCPVFERTAFMTITEGTAEFVSDHVRKLSEAKGIDIPLTSWAQLNPDSPKFTHDFTGAELGFYCKHAEYQGKVNEKWSVAKGTGGGSRPEVDAIDDKAMRNLDALFGKHLSGGASSAKTKAKPSDSVPAKNKRNTAAAMAAQAPVSDGPAPWDENEASAPEDNIPF